MPSYLVTGAGRNLGLAFTQQLLKDPLNKVIATARSTAGSQGLQELAANYSKDRLVLLDLDVTNLESIQNVATQLDSLVPEGLDNFINNAGLNLQPLTSFEDLDIAKYEEELRFNLVSPIAITKAFLPSIKKSKEKKILVLTSVVGSIQLGGFMPNLSNAYSVAKAGLNMLFRKWDAVLKNDGITTILIHPGWISSTGIGNAMAPWLTKYAPNTRDVPIEESAVGCMKVLKEVKIEDTGSFYTFDGSKLPW